MIMLRKFKNYPTFEEAVRSFKNCNARKLGIADRIIKVSRHRESQENKQNVLKKLSKYFKEI
ncbi:hypothetical protein CfvWBT01109_09180 [Campylobacter fetus subsp. venerealis]|nr:hypothetical protein CfvWBT01109_09180 [Campylobacter fetus subsp. venerealis]